MRPPPDMTPIQWISLFVILLIVVEELYYAKLRPEKKLVTWVMMFWMLHAGVYYCFIILDLAINAPMPYTTWSSILRLHGFFTIAGMTYYRILLVKLETKEPRD